MSLATINFSGNAIGMETAMTVILPDAPATAPFPVFYLLHGLSDDHSGWLRRTSIERYMAGIPMIVVMPQTHRGWYTNAPEPIRAYEDHLLKDVIPCIDRFFPTIKSRKGRVLGGLSMGGYGAIKLALKYPDLFCSAASHSGAVMTPLHKPETRPKNLQPFTPEFELIFGKNWRGGPDDPVALAKNCPTENRPALYLDCGTEDFLLDQNREFHHHLTEFNYPHTYQEHPGDHTWSYWDQYIQTAIAFHCKNLGIQIPQNP